MAGLVAVVLVCGACFAVAWFSFLQPAGVGAKAEAGYRSAEPIIKALERYHSDRGTYPDDLQVLTPGYLPDEQLKTWQDVGGQYKVTGKGYQLMFSYVGPCMNTCFYDPVSAKWSCGGYC